MTGIVGQEIKEHLFGKIKDHPMTVTQLDVKRWRGET